MFCSHCGAHAQDGDHFCNNCGASLQTTGGVVQQPYRSDAAPPSLMPADEPKSSRRSGASKPQDPYKDQIAQLKLQIKELKLDLKQITTQMANVRSNYYETAAFVPRGLLRWGYKGVEDFKLLGPQQQKQQLQQHIMQLEQQLLQLQQAQVQWKLQQQN
ncbi:MAG TPA: zinc ribbon domain-containing protein [Ktedonobacteraceae bacterium]|nr:zinc ribbon domain-containing protein [Ktedonobacteraceae bacterium]